MSRARPAGPAPVANVIYRLGRVFAPLARLPFVPWAYSLLQWLSPRRPFLRSVQVHGFTMRVSVLDCSVSRALLAGHVWEPLTTRLFQRLCRPGMVVVDAGAQLGYYTLLAARLVGPQGRAIAFEPDQRHFRLLHATVRLNGLDHVVVAPYAVADQTGTIPMKVNVAAPIRRVPAMRLDEYLGPEDRVDVVKMDIDGGEAEALQGMKGVLARSPSVMLIVEYDRWQHEAAGRSPQAFLDQLRDTGLELGLVIDEESGTARHMDWSELSEVRSSVNLLLSPKGSAALDPAVVLGEG